MYACLTCIPEAKTDPSKYAGICLACSYECHETHELIELYTKRNFRCDCGTPKMLAGGKCNLIPDKSVNNDFNSYSQNFAGLYCTCHRPYPDPEKVDDDEMIQCIICEDWYHSLHLDTDFKDTDAEMICGGCLKQNDFLLSYLEFSVLPPANDQSVNIIDDEPAPKRLKIEATDSNCKLDVLAKPNSYIKGAVYWSENWRQNLCKCEKCIQLYQNKKVEFLIDPDDTVQNYVEKGKNKRQETSVEQEQRILSSLDRVQQVELLTGYNDMKEKLVEFLGICAREDKVVTAEDVTKLFKEMNEERKANREKNQSGYFCR